MSRRYIGFAMFGVVLLGYLAALASLVGVVRIIEGVAIIGAASAWLLLAVHLVTSEPGK